MKGVVGYIILIEEIIGWAVYYIYRDGAYEYAAQLDAQINDTWFKSNSE